MIQYGEVWWLQACIKLYHLNQLNRSSYLCLWLHHLWKLTNQGLLVTRWFSRTAVELHWTFCELGFNSLGCIKQLPPWQADWLIVLSQETGKDGLGKFLVVLTLLKSCLGIRTLLCFTCLTVVSDMQEGKSRWSLLWVLTSSAVSIWATLVFFTRGLVKEPSLQCRVLDLQRQTSTLVL